MRKRKVGSDKRIVVHWHASKQQTEFLLFNADSVSSLGFAVDADEAQRVLASLRRKYDLQIEVRPGAIRR